MKIIRRLKKIGLLVAVELKARRGSGSVVIIHGSGEFVYEPRQRVL